MAENEARLEPLSHEECLELLREGVVGRIAFSVDGFPVILPVNYRLAETSRGVWIALRTRPGNIIKRAPVNVAFEIDGIDQSRRQGWSVLARGTLHAVDPEAADFRERFDPHPWLTGRRLHGARPEWAFIDGAYL
jgi:nitroimidazol reductase NimA-like FMN-containing flavoprotein (pyridoxamine 5'-phosphate oxidase superfamily)